MESPKLTTRAAFSSAFFWQFDPTTTIWISGSTSSSFSAENQTRKYVTLSINSSPHK
jgi:hypothetical protein